MYNELVKRLRNCATEAAPCKTCDLAEDGFCSDTLMRQAVDAIEELANKLCDWCGVCPKERRRPFDCEIMWPNAPIQEVCIEPPKEE